MKILHLDTNHPLLVKQLDAAGYKSDFDFESSKEAIEKVIYQYDGIIIRSRISIDRSFLDVAVNLKFIARVGAGLDSIDTHYANKKRVTIISSPEGNSNAVGEHALGMLLSLFNNLNQASIEVKNGVWNREANRGVELSKKTIGIIGYGNMGQSFAKKLKGFDCKVICYDILPNVGNSYAKQVSLEELQQTADVISLHTPWTSDTDKMINTAFINNVKKSFWIINTARGGSLVTTDLVRALKEGKVLGAGLDVLEYEKLSFESLFSGSEKEQAPLKELLGMKNVIVSPHIAGWTVESREKLAQVIVDKILDKFPLAHKQLKK